MVNIVELAHAVDLLDSTASPTVVNRALQSAGLNRNILREAKGFIPYRLEAKVVEHVARAVGHQHLGAFLAPQFKYDAYNAYASYVLAAHDLGHALRRGQKAFSFIQTGSELVLMEKNDYLLLGRQSDLGSVIGKRHLDDASILIIIQVIRHFLGHSWTPPLIEVPDQNASSVAHLEEMTSAPAILGAKFPAVAVNLSDLCSPNPDMPKPELIVSFAELSALMQIEPPKSTEDLVRNTLTIKLATGDLNEEAVAEHLTWGRRTLQRALRTEGTTFREVKAKFLESRARALLTETNVDVGKIARSLGYEEPKSFARAFREWTGLSPHAYRTAYSEIARKRNTR